MPKRSATELFREQAFREVKALLNLYWSMCGTYAAAEHFDPKLR
jgi:hypothetical protein